ncbi:MAG: hypothetical protein M1831_006912 [Alyxoria varia]|nr:MAG: hypothetical protein M1831_006912 [Alyxoria varia]
MDLNTSFTQGFSKTKAPIHTLALLSGKTYVVSQPGIVNLVSRNAKTISWSPLVTEVGIRLTGASDEAREIIERNLDGSQGKDSYVGEIHDRSIAAMTPGPEMNRISSVMLNDAWSRFLKPIETREARSQVSLYGFLRNLLSVSSTNALYGPQNPILQDPSLEQAFWDFNTNLNPLLLNVHPAITARKGHSARRRAAEAFKSYFDSNPVRRSSSLAEARYMIGRKHGIGTSDLGCLEVGTLIGILVNTVPTLFYLLVHVFMNPSLLADVRKELNDNALRESEDSEDKVVIDMSNVRSKCALLNSTLQETLRVYSEGASARFVTQDTEIDGRLLLKKGNVLQIPNAVLHRDHNTWGDVSFEPRRFMKDSDNLGKNISSTSDERKIKSSTSATSYRPFGGGSTVCPGRHFASMEIIGTAAIMIWRFDLSPRNGKSWTLPPTKQQSIVEAVWPPSHDLEVDFKKRDSAHDARLGMDWEMRFE